ncbi:MAG: peptidase M14, partial [Chlorobiales bacterium]|nr:peptidase M14 [Chlorobiales bacterium]
MTSKHLAELADSMDLRFTSSEAVRGEFIALCKVNPEYASYHCIGFSEEGRPIDAVILGSGKTIVSLIAGAHSDEPVGPETLRIFIIQGLKRKNDLKDLFETYKFVIIPQINPDGEIKNLGWTKEWPNFECYLKHAFRELPGRDIEFGFPEMRKENQAVSRFIKVHAPVKLHLSLHGMGYSEGAMLLIERHWIDRTIRLRKQFKEFVNKFGLGIHDHDRKGEKGFIHIEPGFTTTPEGRAMQAFFYLKRDDETAKLFHLSSMEWVRTLGENPLCLVTELPLFLIQKKADIPEPGVPKQYMALKELTPSLSAKLRQG